MHVSHRTDILSNYTDPECGELELDITTSVDFEVVPCMLHTSLVYGVEHPPGGV